MALEFLSRSRNRPRSVAVFPGAWNPPTIAHLRMARAALKHAEEILWTIPRRFPHKRYEGATFEERCEMIRAIAASESGFSAAIADGGLYIEMAHEAAAAFDDAEITLLCGRDAAERIERWDYGRERVFHEMVRDFGLIVASRMGEYSTDIQHRGRITFLNMGEAFDEVSSSEVRRRIAAGAPWRHLVPPVIHPQVQRIQRWTDEPL